MGAIYRITHKASGTTYVGSTADVKKRWRDHQSLLRHGRHDNPRLQCAHDKYGAAAFEWVVLEDRVADEDLAGREQFWLDEYRRRGEVYNYGECVVSNRRGVRHIKETRHKMSEAHKGQKPWNAGLKLSEEHRRKMSSANKGKSLSEEHRHKISEANAGPYPAFVRRQTGAIIMAGRNLRAMCERHGLCLTSMWRVTHGQAKSHKGWVLG